MTELTIVYSTRKFNPQFERHLRESCGYPTVEILSYVNDGQHGLSLIYNQALKTATHDLIVFVHDDVLFKTRDWGSRLQTHFEQSEFGILGVAGTSRLADTGIWWQMTGFTLGRVWHQPATEGWMSAYSADFGDQRLSAVVVDGLLIAVKRSRLHAEFHEGLTGFHFYDMDFCLSNYWAGVKIGVIFNVLVVHRSTGQPDSNWEQERQQFLGLHHYHLPCAVMNGELCADQSPVELAFYPKVAVIILHKMRNDLLFNCLNSFVEKSKYPNLEFIIADTGSDRKKLSEIRQLVEESGPCFRMLEWEDYHFAKVNNRVVVEEVATDTELLLFCNNDVELINDAVSRTVQVYLEHRDCCGTVGCRLHFADRRVQHAGIELRKEGEGKWQIGHVGEGTHYGFSPNTERQKVGCTAAFLLINRDLFVQLGGFNEAYQECLEDVELNIRCLQQGRVNYYVGGAVAYHFGSQSRKVPGVLAVDYQRLCEFLSKTGYGV